MKLPGGIKKRGAPEERWRQSPGPADKNFLEINEE
jgi:hypothetical protein